MPGYASPAALTVGTRRVRSCRVAKIQALLAAVVLSGGCASWHVADADREVHALLAEYENRTLGDRAEWVRQPAQLPEPAGPASAPSDIEHAGATSAPSDGSAVTITQSTAPKRLTLDLPTSLRLAFSSSRNFLDEKEDLYLQGLSFTLTRYNFGPILNSTISYLWSDAENASGDDSLAATLGASQILPTGGDLSVSGTVTGSRGGDPDLFDPPDPAEYDYDSTVQLNLSQPLLRGFGYEISHESLTQGERNLIYALRSFELFRQDFCISVTDAYYGLVGQKRQLANQERSYQDAVFDRQKTESLQQLDRAKQDDVFLARRREIQANDTLLVARTSYELALDDFKILLGLPTSTQIEIPDETPVFKPVRIEPRSAVEVALHNRLDLHTLRDRLEDTERQVRLAHNDLLPDLDLSVDWGFANQAEKSYDPMPERWSATVGAVLEVPLDRKSERNAYRSSLISLAQARRSLAQRLDEVERDLLDQLRELTQLEKQTELQREQVKYEQRAVTVTRIRYESGDAEARDLLDARQALVDAQNSLIDLETEHFIARLTLRRNLGVLFVDQEGMWQE